MSLILDALEQAERERQDPPALHRLMQAPSATADPPTKRLAWLGWLAAGAALALATVLSWQRWGGDAPANVPAAGVPQRPTAAAIQLPTLPALPNAPAQTTGTALFAPAAVSAPVPQPAAPPAPAPTPAPPAKPEAVVDRAHATPSAKLPTTAAASEAPGLTAEPPPAPTPVPTASELPAPTRARLPSLTITGHTYSDNPTLRTLMIDGRMLVEGQTLSPGLRLERIERHQAVFSQGGTRFSVGY